MRRILSFTRNSDGAQAAQRRPGKRRPGKRRNVSPRGQKTL